MKFRAVTRRDSLTLVPEEFAGVHGGPMACLARAALRPGVSVADIKFGEEDEDEAGVDEESEDGVEATAEDREVEVRFLANDVLAARRVIKRWASTAGHKRVWFKDEVVELDPADHIDGDYATTCSSCGLEITDSGQELTKFVHSVGHFPLTCFICGGFVPQWEPARVEAADERDGSRRGRRTRGNEHTLRAVDA